MDPYIICNEQDFIGFANDRAQRQTAGSHPKIDRALHDYRALARYAADAGGVLTLSLVSSPALNSLIASNSGRGVILGNHAALFTAKKIALIVAAAPSGSEDLANMVEAMRAATYQLSNLFAYPEDGDDSAFAETHIRARHFALIDIACAGYLATRFDAGSYYEACKALPAGLGAASLWLHENPLALGYDTGTIRDYRDFNERFSLPQEKFSTLISEIGGYFTDMFSEAHYQGGEPLWRLANMKANELAHDALALAQDFSHPPLKNELTRIARLPDNLALKESMFLLGAFENYRPRLHQDQPGLGRAFTPDSLPPGVEILRRKPEGQKPPQRPGARHGTPGGNGDGIVIFPPASIWRTLKKLER